LTVYYGNSGNSDESEQLGNEKTRLMNYDFNELLRTSFAPEIMPQPAEIKSIFGA
jgi:hypothetical protein